MKCFEDRLAVESSVTHLDSEQAGIQWWQAPTTRRARDLERFVRHEPLRRVHECVFGVLAWRASRSIRGDVV